MQTRNASGMTVSKATGCGRRKRAAETDIHLMPGMEMQQNLLAKFRIDVVVRDADAEPLIDEICAAAYTGKYGDGKIFVYDVIDAVRIRTKERGDAAL